jgi:hypothetical protein
MQSSTHGYVNFILSSHINVTHNSEYDVNNRLVEWHIEVNRGILTRVINHRNLEECYSGQAILVINIFNILTVFQFSFTVYSIIT